MSYLRHKAFTFLEDHGHSSQDRSRILILTKGEQKVHILRELIDINGFLDSLAIEDRGSPGLFLPQCDVADRLQVFHTSKSCGVSDMDQRPFGRGPSRHGPGYRPPVLTTRYRWTLPTSHGSGHYFLFFFFTQTPDIYNCPFLTRKTHLFLYHGHFIYCVSYTYLVTMRRPPTARLLFLSLSMYLFSFLCVP